MILGLLVLTTALAISGVAAYYSIIGLAAIFAAAAIPVIIMGSILEVGKLVTVTYLHREWKHAPFLLKSYLVIAVVVLMFITSMGIFGFLSRAHIEQTTITGDNTLRIERLDSQIEREQRVIKDADQVLSQLDNSINVLIEFDRIRGKDGAIATREGQKSERAELSTIIGSAEDRIQKLQEEQLILDKEQIKLEAEVGPIKYIAEFVYGEKANKSLLEEAVRWVIVIIVAVFDPLAVALLVAWNDLRMRITPTPPVIRKPNPPKRNPAPQEPDTELEFMKKPDIPNEQEQEQMAKKCYVWDLKTLSYKRIKAGATS
jgi:hypothetical protein